jgi:hypothetical protein
LFREREKERGGRGEEGRERERENGNVSAVDEVTRALSFPSFFSLLPRQAEKTGAAGFYECVLARLRANKV